MKNNRNTLTEHLLELRNRLLIIISTIAICALAFSPFANSIYNFLSLPLLGVLTVGSSMIAIDVASPFLAPFKLILLLSIAVTFLLLFITFGPLFRRDFIKMKKN